MILAWASPFIVEHFFKYIAMCDLMLSSTHDNKVIFHVCNVRIVDVWKTMVTVFQYKNPLPKWS